MKKILSTLFLILLCFSITSCKKEFKSEKEIKSNFSIFDIEADIDENTYHFVKSTNGHFVSNKDTGISYYYNISDDLAYGINLEKQEKILINDKSIIENTLESLYNLLTSHTDINASWYTKKGDVYLDRNVTIYSYNDGNIEETFYVDDVTGACLYFYSNTGSKKVLAKLNSISFEDTNLDMYNDYKTVESHNASKLKEKDEILNHLDNFDITFDIDSNTVRIVKNVDGIYYSYEGSTPVIYEEKTKKWYSIDEFNKTRSIYNYTTTKEEILNNLYTLLVGYLDNLSVEFFEESSDILEDEDVIKYENIFRNEEYHVDEKTGICLKSKIKGTSTVTYKVTSYDLTVETLPWLDYDVVKATEYYKEWPKDHEYLEGVDKWDFGTFHSGVADYKSLQIIYNDISENNFNRIKTKFEDAGYNINTEVDKLSNGYYYIYYIIDTENEKGYKLNLSFYGEDEQLIITITE